MKVSLNFQSALRKSGTWDCACGMWDLAFSQFLWWDLERSVCNVIKLKELRGRDCPIPATQGNKNTLGV